MIGLTVIVVWQALALTVFAGRFVVPPPGSVLTAAADDNFYLSDLLVTLGISWKGWLLGNGVALALAAICLVVPATETGLLTLGVATYCVPTIAVGPLLVVTSGAHGAKVMMSALSVFFVTLVAAVAGLGAASPTSLEVVTAFGGGALQQLLKVRIRAGVPMLASGLCISAPAAILGTIIGDYLGGENGLGVILLQAQQQLAVSRTWAIGLVTTAVCGSAFGLTAMLARRFGADFDAPLDSGLVRTGRAQLGLRSVGLGLLKVAGAIAFGLAVWLALIKVSGLSAYFVKSPADMWQYVLGDDTALEHRQALWQGLVQTMGDAGFGWLAGTTVALVCAAALILFPAVNAAVMPLVLVLRSVPFIAMCPLIGLVFGRGLLGVTIIAGMVTFVPSLVTVADGLRTAPMAATDLIHCCGGGPWAALMKVRGPFAAPALFAAAKISMPGAVLGSVLAEWLITGHGLGKAMSYDVISSNYANLWASILTILVISLALYLVVGALETAIRNR